jgi:hypothetical protein
MAVVGKNDSLSRRERAAAHESKAIVLARAGEGSVVAHGTL